LSPFTHNYLEVAAVYDSIHHIQIIYYLLSYHTRISSELNDYSDYDACQNNKKITPDHVKQNTSSANDIKC